MGATMDHIVVAERCKEFQTKTLTPQMTLALHVLQLAFCGFALAKIAELAQFALFCSALLRFFLPSGCGL